MIHVVHVPVDNRKKLPLPVLRSEKGTKLILYFTISTIQSYFPLLHHHHMVLNASLVPLTNHVFLQH